VFSPYFSSFFIVSLPPYPLLHTSWTFFPTLSRDHKREGEASKKGIGGIGRRMEGQDRGRRDQERRKKRE